MPEFLTRLVRYRSLLLHFSSQEVKERYVGSASGFLWVLIHPLLLLGIYAFVFSIVFRVFIGELGETKFVTFVAVALWPWLMFQEGLQRAMLVIHRHAALIRKVAFPRELLVYAAVISTTLLHLAGYVLVLGVLIAIGEPLHLKGALLAMLTFASMAILCAALALVLAPLHVVLRDIEQGIGPLLTMVFYATPILYPLSQVPQALRPWLSWNPLAYPVERLHAAWLQGALPTAMDGVYFAATLLCFAACWWIFNRIAPHFEDLL